MYTIYTSPNKETKQMSDTNTSNVAVGGTSFLNLLFLTFLVLKLTKVIDWSWWWVTAPLWIPFGLLLGILVVGLCAVIILTVIFNRDDKWKLD